MLVVGFGDDGVLVGFTEDDVPIVGGVDGVPTVGLADVMMIIKELAIIVSFVSCKTNNTDK